MELTTGLIIFGVILISVYLSWTLNNKAYNAIDAFNAELKQVVLFKPYVKWNNKTYVIDRIKKWAKDDKGSNWLTQVEEPSKGDLFTEFTVDENKFVAVYKQADDAEDAQN